MTQEQKRAKWREYYRKTHPEKPPRVYYHSSLGRLVVHKGCSLKLFWNNQMTEYLKNNYATTINEELAEWLGVSMRTVIRKAREYGLQKDKNWLESIHNERRRMAHAANKAKGYPGAFKKGQHASPATEFKKGSNKQIKLN